MRLQGSEDIMAVDLRDDWSDSFAMNDLEDAVYPEKVKKLRELGRRPSLSTLVIVRPRPYSLYA